MSKKMKDVAMSAEDLKEYKAYLLKEHGTSKVLLRVIEDHLVVDIPDGWMLVTKGKTKVGDMVYCVSNEFEVLMPGGVGNSIKDYVGVIRKITPGQAGLSFKYVGKNTPIPMGYYRVSKGNVEEGDLLFNRPTGEEPGRFERATIWSIGDRVDVKLCVVRKVK